VVGAGDLSLALEQLTFLKAYVLVHPNRLFSLDSLLALFRFRNGNGQILGFGMGDEAGPVKALAKARASSFP